MDLLAKPFGALMQLIYQTIGFHNYGIAIIVFTLIVRILMFPFALKQQRSMIRQQELAPELKELQKNYGNDRNKMAEEQQKLYQKYNISPLSGCLPMLLQFPILITLYTIIRNPLTYISMLPTDTVDKLKEFWKGIQVAAGKMKDTVQLKSIQQIDINSYFFSNTDKIAQVSDSLSKSDFINTTFLGIFDLGKTASWQFWTWGADWKIFLPLFFLPLLSLLTTYMQQMLITNNNKKDKKEADTTTNTMNVMTKLMPLITFFIAFSVPSGLVFYWIIGNILSIGQTVLINKLFAKQKEG